MSRRAALWISVAHRLLDLRLELDVVARLAEPLLACTESACSERSSRDR